eukprot:6214557-Pleurochrysis_carterae.AAC.4
MDTWRQCKRVKGEGERPGGRCGVLVGCVWGAMRARLCKRARVVMGVCVRVCAPSGHARNEWLQRVLEVREQRARADLLAGKQPAFMMVTSGLNVLSSSAVGCDQGGEGQTGRVGHQTKLGPRARTRVMRLSEVACKGSGKGEDATCMDCSIEAARMQYAIVVCTAWTVQYILRDRARQERTRRLEAEYRLASYVAWRGENERRVGT